jgi:vacuolar-type H+-ATPase subunit H
VIVDEDRMLDIIDQMRVSIPDEIKKAQQVVAQKDRMMAQANEESKRTLDLAREKGEQIVERDNIVQAAQTRAEQVLAQVCEEANQTRREADEYVVDTLHDFEVQLERILNQVRNGIKTLQSEGLGDNPDTLQKFNEDDSEQ